MSTEGKKTLVALGLLVVAIAMIVFGFYRGENIVVLHKAASICLECIGIG